ncbi:MAG TPA: hypothetical protein VJN93_12665 [Candidatus Acidoferrum sp.]|nr:hypothetical protein [Candidatus Acidoferrum sp.]
MRRRAAQRVAISILALAVCGVGLAADKLSELQTRFDHESNAVHKAKLVEKLGDEEFEEAGQAEQKGDYSRMGLLLEKYRDNVRDASSALLKANPDAVHHPNGYKQLEMHVQKGLRQLDEFLLEAPDPYKPPLQLVRQDLIAVDNQLLRSLFPATPLDKTPHHHPSAAPSPAQEVL